MQLIILVSWKKYVLVECENSVWFFGISELWEHCFFRCLRKIEVCSHPHGSTSISEDTWTVLAVC